MISSQILRDLSLSLSHSQRCFFLFIFLQVLSVQQLYRLCTLYYDDNYNTPDIDTEVSWMNIWCLEIHLLIRTTNCISSTFLFLFWYSVVNLILCFAQVISSIKEKVPEDYNDDDINSFVLEDNSRYYDKIIPYSFITVRTCLAWSEIFLPSWKIR